MGTASSKDGCMFAYLFLCVRVFTRARVSMGALAQGHHGMPPPGTACPSAALPTDAPPPPVSARPTH